jgi:hypothetical protein
MQKQGRVGHRADFFRQPRWAALHMKLAKRKVSFSTKPAVFLAGGWADFWLLNSVFQRRLSLKALSKGKPKPGPPALRAVGSTSRKPGCKPYGLEAGPGFFTPYVCKQIKNKDMQR